jgi:hypothetical protein
MVYWAMSLPALDQGVAQAFQQHTSYRSFSLRRLEPMTAPEERVPDLGPGRHDGAAIAFGGVEVQVGVTGPPQVRPLGLCKSCTLGLRWLATVWGGVSC